MTSKRQVAVAVKEGKGKPPVHLRVGYRTGLLCGKDIKRGESVTFHIAEVTCGRCQDTFNGK